MEVQHTECFLCMLALYSAYATTKVAAGLIAFLVCRNPLQVIETGSYNFCRMAIFSLDPHSFQQLTANPKLTSKQAHKEFLGQDKELQQSGSSLQGTEKLCSHSAEPGQEHRSSVDEQPASEVTETARQESIAAIAGHDPAVLEIWNMTASTPLYAHVCPPSPTCVS